MLPFINIVGRNVSFGEPEHLDYASSSCLASAGSSKLPTISEGSFTLSGKPNKFRHQQKHKQNNVALPFWSERSNVEESRGFSKPNGRRRSPDKLPKTGSRLTVQPTEMHLEYNLKQNKHSYTLPLSKQRPVTERLSTRTATQQLELPSAFDLDPTELSSLKPHGKVHRKRKKRYELPGLSLDVVTTPQSPQKSKSPTPIVLPQHNMNMELLSNGQSSEMTSPSWPSSPPPGQQLMYKVVITKAPEAPRSQNTQEVLQSPPSKNKIWITRMLPDPMWISTYARKRRELADKRKREATQRKIVRPKLYRSKTEVPKASKPVEEKPKTPPPKRQERTSSPESMKLPPHVEEYYPISMEVTSPLPDEEEDMDKMEVETVVDNYSNLSVTPVPSVHRPKTPKLLKVDKDFLSSLADHDALSKAFKKLDTNGDGHLSFPEVKSTFPHDLSPNQITYIKKMYDLACENTFFGLEEFIGVTCFCKMASRSPISHSFKTLQPSQVDYLLRTYIELFADIDRKAKGIIPASSIQEILSSATNSRCKSATVGKILKEMHKSPNDDINGIEFLVYIPYLASQLSS